ncbi:hypothetical protein BaRGS_00022192 [Batillaria attramentaria]|uniref:Uncharacterized protein n=1 Tax=Batillaria attramentaria TaxID=370345 RepID=A0ABD0KHH9_9CAEN
MAAKLLPPATSRHSRLSKTTLRESDYCQTNGEMYQISSSQDLSGKAGRNAYQTSRDGEDRSAIIQIDWRGKGYYPRVPVSPEPSSRNACECNRRVVSPKSGQDGRQFYRCNFDSN